MKNISKIGRTVYSLIAGRTRNEDGRQICRLSIDNISWYTRIPWGEAALAIRELEAKGYIERRRMIGEPIIILKR